MDIFLPWQVHYQSGFLYEDPSYMMSISLHFNPLLVPPSHILQIYYLTPHFPRNFHKCGFRGKVLQLPRFLLVETARV